MAVTSQTFKVLVRDTGGAHTPKYVSHELLSVRDWSQDNINRLPRTTFVIRCLPKPHHVVKGCLRPLNQSLF